MHYDASLIETSTIVIDGKEIAYQRIPAGMSGPNGCPPVLSDNDNFETSNLNSALSKELESYMNEGEDPDSDEVRAIKEEIEKDQCEDFLETLSVDEWEAS